jgi:hypothetical protein
MKASAAPNLPKNLRRVPIISMRFSFAVLGFARHTLSCQSCELLARPIFAKQFELVLQGELQVPVIDIG